MKRILAALVLALASSAAVGQIATGFMADFQGRWLVGNVAGDCVITLGTSGNSATLTSSCTGTGGVAFGTLATATTATPVVNLFTGCSGTMYLGADNACHTASGSGTVTSVNLTSTGSTVTITPTSGTNPCTTSCTLDLEAGSNVICAGALATASSTTGTTSETNLENCTISAGAANTVGAVLRITTTWFRNATTTDSTQFVVRMCTASACTSGGLNIQSPTDSTSGSVQYYTQTLVYVTGSATELVPVIGTPSGTSGGSAPTAGTQNMAAQQFIAFNCKNVTSSADTCGIYTWTVELVP